MNVIAASLLGGLFFVYALAKGAISFHFGPRWMRRLIIDEDQR